MTTRRKMPEADGIVLQLCPNDHPPFLDICRVYKLAGESLGYEVPTVFLSPPTAAPSDECRYLGAENLRHTREIGRALANTVRECVSMTRCLF